MENLNEIQIPEIDIAMAEMAMISNDINLIVESFSPQLELMQKFLEGLMDTEIRPESTENNFTSIIREKNTRKTIKTN